MKKRLTESVACSDCFVNEGLIRIAQKYGEYNKVENKCKRCDSAEGKPLFRKDLEKLVEDFFIRGTYSKTSYGGASIITYSCDNETNTGLINEWMEKDWRIIKNILDIDFDYNNPSELSLGNTTVIENLKNVNNRKETILKLIDKCSNFYLDEKVKLYRVRRNIEKNKEIDISEYDSSPFPGRGRFDSEEFPVLYVSEDLELCIHECRVTSEDELYFATLVPKKKLKILDLTNVQNNWNDYEPYEDLNHAIFSIFNTRESYGILKEFSKTVKEKGYD